MADVQHRLSQLGFDPGADPVGQFGAATRAALEAFQHRRGLKIDGVCGRQTWDTLVEAGFRLGDRLLYRRTPMLRGDDVADVQQRLAALGFDTGRVDGIFGDLTSEALREFQSNAGLPVDGIVGTETLECLRRMQQPPGGVLGEPALVSTVRARLLLSQSPRNLIDRHVAIGETGGLLTAVTALARRLRAVGALATEFHHPDQSTHAQSANAAGAEVYLGMRLDPATEGCRTAYYAGYRDESPGGHRLADLVQAHVPAVLGIADLGAVGMSVPVLRETRMTAVVVELGPAETVVEHGAALADAVADALVEWARTVGD